MELIKQTENYSLVRLSNGNSKLKSRGGLRIKFGEKTSIADLKFLAKKMQSKCYLHGLNFVGAIGEIALHTNDNAMREIALNEYVKLWCERSFHLADILSPDIGIDLADLAIINSQMINLGVDPEKSLTGKSLDKGGVIDKRHSTADLAFKSLAHKSLLGDFIDSRDLLENEMLVQGFGSVGRRFSQNVINSGGKIVGISNSSGVYVKTAGFSLKDFESLEKYLVSKNPSDLFSLKATSVILAYKESSVTWGQLASTGAKTIVELANNPIIEHEDREGYEKSVVLVPSELINVGGLLFSIFENDASISKSQKSNYRYLLDSAEVLIDATIKKVISRADGKAGLMSRAVREIIGESNEC